MSDKITISWDELKTRKVEQRLGQMVALERNRAYAQLTDVAPDPSPRASSLLYNTLVYMSLFGLLGGSLAWTCGTLLHFRPSAWIELGELQRGVKDIRTVEFAGRLTHEEAEAAVQQVGYSGRRNPYFVIYNDPKLSETQKETRINQIRARDHWKEFIANMISFGVTGMIIALCLSTAEAVVSRNIPSIVVNGSVGATLGLMGGVAVALFLDPLYRALGGQDGAITSSRQILARAIAWAVVGFTLTLGPGIVMRSWKKFAIGAAGGVIGGAVGGAMYDAVYKLSDNQSISRLVSLLSIGLVAGLGSGLIENAAKNGWLRVVQGLIAGKQFILYRNPTFIGSSPDNHIYLFKDQKVGRRHAAIHLVQGGFEIEDLPLGEVTMVNGSPVTRTRLRHGDRIQIGSTALLFQEKQPSM